MIARPLHKLGKLNVLKATIRPGSKTAQKTPTSPSLLANNGWHFLWYVPKLQAFTDRNLPRHVTTTRAASSPPASLPRRHWYLHNSQFFVTCSVARDWAAFNGGGSLVNFSVTMDRPQCEGPPHNEGSGEISTRAEGVVAHGVILLLHVDLENPIPRGLTLT